MNGLFTNVFAGALLVVSMLPAPARAQSATASVDRIALLGGSGNVEIEIRASQRMTPQVQVLTGPERLVIDFPGAVPASTLHNLSAARGQVKSIRVGLFASNPPVTRIVLDLKSPQQYELFPSGKTIIVKLRADIKPVAVLTTTAAKLSTPVAPPIQLLKPATKVEVEFRNGKLTISANKATLAEVLYEVQRKTGADIPIPSDAQREQVVGSFGPAPAREVMASLLNGSRFNFILVASDNDPTQLRSVVLTPRGDAVPQPAYVPPPPVAQAMTEPSAPQVQPDPPSEERDQDEPAPKQQ
jgi:AMIN domain-containing protein